MHYPVATERPVRTAPLGCYVPGYSRGFRVKFRIVSRGHLYGYPAIFLNQFDGLINSMHVRENSFVRVLACLALLTSSTIQAAVFPWVGEDINGLACETGETEMLRRFGPFDYTDTRNANTRRWLDKVERVHYTPHMRRLAGGNTSSIEGDLHYTLSAFPNHHQALFTLVRLYTESCKLCRPSKADISNWKKSFPPPECYLNRGLAAFKKDSIVPAIYGVYLHRLGRLEEAAQMYERSLALKSATPEVHYNYGLLLVDLDRLDEAQKHADIAYKAGYPLTGLRMKIKHMLKDANASSKTE